MPPQDFHDWAHALDAATLSAQPPSLASLAERCGCRPVIDSVAQAEADAAPESGAKGTSAPEIASEPLAAAGNAAELDAMAPGLSKADLDLELPPSPDAPLVTVSSAAPSSVSLPDSAEEAPDALAPEMMEAMVAPDGEDDELLQKSDASTGQELSRTGQQEEDKAQVTPGTAKALVPILCGSSC
jgi:hypothetical protein